MKMCIKTLCLWSFVDNISAEEFVLGHLRPTENIVTDAAKEPGNFMQVIAIDIIGSERLGLGNGHWAWAFDQLLDEVLLAYCIKQV